MIFTKINNLWYNDNRPQDNPYHSLKHILAKFGRKVKILQVDKRGSEIRIDINDEFAFHGEKQQK